MHNFSFFKDLKIVEFASVLAGPSVGMFFAELGATVIKIESPLGDMTRKWKLKSEDAKSKSSAYYSSINWGKDVIHLDLKNEPDCNTAIEIIKESDILISNFKQGDAEKFGLDYEKCSQLNPAIIYAHLSGYGSTEKRTAFDVVIQAETGFMSMNGQAGSPPTKMPVALMDVLAAHQLKEAILCGLLDRFKTGIGCKVEANLYETGISALTNQATNWLMANSIAKQQGSQHPNIAPYGDQFICKDDKWIVLAIGTNKQFIGLCLVLKAKELIDSPFFISNELRVQNRKRLNEILGPYFKQNNASYFASLFVKSDIPAGIVKNIDEVFEDSKDRNLLLHETVNGELSTRVKSVVFEKTDSPKN